MSSNRYNGQNNRIEGGKKGYPNTQKKQQFVPKKETHNTQTQTLSNSLRQSQSQSQSQSDGAANSGAGELKSRVTIGNSGNFVEYLPQDEAVAAGLGADEGALDSVESQRVVDVSNRELSRLLKMNSRDFWREVASDPSLHSFLESFLKFRSRWYDFPYRGARGTVAGVIVGEFELCRRVFMVLYRISSNRDPGAKTADSLSQSDHAALLQEKKFLDIPKLLDICAIYGHENEDLTRILVINSIKSQPWIHDDLPSVVSHFLSIVQTMYQRCSSSLEVLFSSGHLKDHGHSRLQKDYLEAMDFLNDAVVSMDAFVNAYKQASIYFCCPVEMSHGSEEVLTTLARLHDQLLPSLRRGFHIIFTSEENGSPEASYDMRSNVTLSLKMLSTRIADFGWKLLYSCYLSDEAFVESYPVPATMKMFPANVEDPAIRADILMQSVRDINGDYSQALEGHSKKAFLQIIDKSHNIMKKIELLQNTGWISMDDDQFKFLSGIVMHPVEDNIGRASHLNSAKKDNQPHADEDTAIVESKISQIKDLFPDYGKGFLAACLEVYNQNPEEVIQRILEGTLHEDLLSLDISLEKIPQPKSVAPSVTRNDKGKGKLMESAPMPPTNIVPAAATYIGGGSSNSSKTSVGRFIRKTTADVPDSVTLNSRNEKDLAKTMALASQLEYEDEYDDSFDDLGLSVGDSGFEETENLQDKSKLSHGKPWEGDNGSSATNASNSKWGSRKKPQFYVKDGKNYSYKVEGSTAVANYNEASILNQAQKDTIHGLGRGGNLPLGAVKRMNELNVEQDDEKDDEPEPNEMGGRGGRGSFRGRGRRGGGGRSQHYRKDQAMKKHFSGVTGF